MLIWRHGWNLNAALSFERLDVIKLKYLFATSWFINLCNNGHLQGGVYWFKIFPFQPFRCLLAVKAFFLHFYLKIFRFILLWFFFFFVFLKICNYIFFWFVSRDAEMWWIMNIILQRSDGNLKLKGVLIFFVFKFHWFYKLCMKMWLIIKSVLKEKLKC